MGQPIEFGGVCIDCGPDQFESMVAFYASILGAEVVHHEKAWASLCDPRHTFVNIQGPGLVCATSVARTASGSNQEIHFECGVKDMDDAVAQVVQSGGRVAPYQPYDRDRGEMIVALDPAGHPFCLLAS